MLHAAARRAAMFGRRGGKDGGIRLPPGGHVTLEISQDGMRVVQQEQVQTHTQTYTDPLGGPPLEVSSHLMPDAMALYLLSTSLIECARALESHEAVVQRAMDTNKQVAAASDRSAWWSKGVIIACGVLAAISFGNFGFSLWDLWRGH